MASHFIEIRRCVRRELCLDYVAAVLRTIRRGTFELDDLLAALDQSFGEQKAGGKFQVVPGRAHGDAQRMIANADFERLFTGEIVVLAAQLSVVPLVDLREI